MIASVQRDSVAGQGRARQEKSSVRSPIKRAVPEPYVGEKWPKWKSAAFLVLFCGSAWALIGATLWLLLR